MSAQRHKVHVLFVCGGNTCRSPMAEALANARYGHVLSAESAGTDAWESAANDVAVQVLRDKFGISISHHKPRDIDGLGTEDFDLVVAMDRPVARYLAGYEPRIKRLEVWDVADPHNRGRPVYEAAAQQILRQVEHLVRRLTQAGDDKGGGG